MDYPGEPVPEKNLHTTHIREEEEEGFAQTTRSLLLLLLLQHPKY